MISWVVVCAAAAACLSGLRAQPVSCRYDDQCPSSSYCHSELLTCLSCLSCEALHREPPTLASKCVRYVAECGSCLPGLVPSSDGSDGCVEAVSEGLPVYVWTVIGIGLLLLVLFVSAVLFYILRNTDTFKMTSATSVETQRAPREVAPTAPPPYNGHYQPSFEPVRPSSPPSLNASDAEEPLVKRAGSGHPSGGARESSASQAARVFNNPAYVRGPHLPPPSYEEAFSEGSDTEAFVPAPDEDTMESVWTPAQGNHITALDIEASNAAAATSSEASNATALVRRPSRTELAPPAKIHCVREDTNNNRGSSSGAPPPPPPSPPRAPSLVINVLNVNTVHHQHPYDVTL